MKFFAGASILSNAGGKPPSGSMKFFAGASILPNSGGEPASGSMHSLSQFLIRAITRKDMPPRQPRGIGYLAR
jgi:hypothetical protein